MKSLRLIFVISITIYYTLNKKKIIQTNNLVKVRTVLIYFNSNHLFSGSSTRIRLLFCYSFDCKIGLYSHSNK